MMVVAAKYLIPPPNRISYQYQLSLCKAWFNDVLGLLLA
jgi:hypothetical protein